MFWMANALDWNAKPIVLQTFASSTFHGVSRVVDDRLTAFCFEQFMSCNFRHLVTTTHGNLTSAFFLGNGCNDVATMLKFCKALSDLVNLLILRSSGFTRMKVRCILPQAFNQKSQVHDVSVTLNHWHFAHKKSFGTGRAGESLEQGRKWQGRTEFRHYSLKSPERCKYIIPQYSSCNQCHGQEMQSSEFPVIYTLQFDSSLIFFK